VAFYGPVGDTLLEADTGHIALRPSYRVQQFLAALSSRGAVHEAELRAHLSPAQVSLFGSMSASEQRHALRVLRTLEETGHADPALAQAALLHDVGKVLPSARQSEPGQRVRLSHRVAAVLLEAIHPSLLCRVALDESASWRYPFFVLVHHASVSLGKEGQSARTSTISPAGISLAMVASLSTGCGHLSPRTSNVCVAIFSSSLLF